MQKAEVFNNHFAKKSKLKGSHEEPPELNPIPTLDDLTNINTSPYEIGPLIKGMKNADFSPCGVPARFIKEIYSRFGSKISSPIAKLLNIIFKPMRHPTLSVRITHLRYSEALDELEQLREVAPREASVYFLMGRIFKKLEMPNRAMLNFSLALDLKPSSADVNSIKAAIEKLHVPEEEEEEEL